MNFSNKVLAIVFASFVTIGCSTMYFESSSCINKTYRNFSEDLHLFPIPIETPTDSLNIGDLTIFLKPLMQTLRETFYVNALGISMFLDYTIVFGSEPLVLRTRDPR